MDTQGQNIGFHSPVEQPDPKQYHGGDKMKNSLIQQIRTWARERAGRFLLTQLAHTTTMVIVLAVLLLGAVRVGALDGVLASLAAPATDTNFTTVNYQGRLADSDGIPINNTSPGIGMTFALYDVDSGGSPVWTEPHTNVPVSEGLFSVRLGSTTALDTSDLAGDRWLGIQVGTDPEMSPREKLAAVPYAMVAGELAGPVEFGGRSNSYPYVMGLSQFLRHQSWFCYGLVPAESDGTHTCPLGSLHDFFDTRLLVHSASGVIRTAVNSPGSPRWGYSFAFFLSNPGAATSLNIPFSTNNDIAIYVLTGPVTGDNLGDSGTMVYHRTPGTSDGGEGCPADTITHDITIPSGDFRLVILTRGGDCTSYIVWPHPTDNWIAENGLEIDWSNLQTYLGEY